MFGFFKKRKFQKAFKAAVSDGVLTTDEGRSLANFADELNLGQSHIDQARADHFRKLASPIMSEIVSSRRMSRAQEAKLFGMAAQLQIEPDFGANLSMCRELWAWENGEQVYLPETEAPVLLKAKEVCCLSIPAVWKQMKVVKTRIATRGFSTSFRIMKGLSYRVHNLKPVYSESEGLASISTGILSLTNKRVVFTGQSRSTSIDHGRILDIELYEDGIEVSKASGKHDFFVMDPIAAEYSVMALNIMSR